MAMLLIASSSDLSVRIQPYQDFDKVEWLHLPVLRTKLGKFHAGDWSVNLLPHFVCSLSFLPYHYHAGKRRCAFWKDS